MVVNHFPLVLLPSLLLEIDLLCRILFLKEQLSLEVKRGRILTCTKHRGTQLHSVIRQPSGYQCLYLLFYIGPYFPLNSLCPPDMRYVSCVQA